MNIKHLYLPPSLRLPGSKHERHATWLELFYDLVFVVAVSQLASGLSSDLSFHGILQFLGLFLPVWWAWVGHTVYSTRFDTDDLVHRFITFLKMLAAAGMAVQIPRALDGDGCAEFAAAYVIARACLLILYVRAGYHVPQARRMTTLYVAGFGTGVALWTVSIFAPPSIRYELWALGLAVDFLTPWIGRRVLQRAPLDTSHLPERFGLFTIIVLGESVLGVVHGISHVHWYGASIVTGVLGFFMVVSLWWLYFVSVDDTYLDVRLGSGQPYIYSHIPLLVATAAIGVGVEHIIVEAAHEELSAEVARILCGSLIVWLASFVLIRCQTVHPIYLRQLLIQHAGAIALIAVVWGATERLPPIIAMLALTLITVGLVSLEVAQGRLSAAVHDTQPRSDVPAP